MAILPKENRENQRRVIDLSGPDGNAFHLLGYARSLGRQLGKSEEEIKKISEEMRSGDYENLLTVFDKYYGQFVDLQR